jgi:hypothetical protein
MSSDRSEAEMSRKYEVLALVLGAALVVAIVPTVRADGPFQFHSLTPCRVVDTRVAGTTTGTYGGILTSGVEKVYPIQGNCGVPVGAKAVTLNVTAVTPTNQGRFTVYPSGIPTPTVSTINFPVGTTALANGAIVPISAGVACATFTPSTCDLAVMPFVVPGTGQVHLVLDITGYFQ